METKQEQTHGTARFNCVNHPTLRWTKTKYAHPDHVSPYMGEGRWIFNGEQDGLPSSIDVWSESDVANLPPEDQRRYRERFTPECDCPGSDLRFLEWVS